MKIMVKASVEDMLRGVRSWIGDGTTEVSVDRIAQMFLSINDFVLIGAAAEPGKYLFADRKTVEALEAERQAQTVAADRKVERPAQAAVVKTAKAKACNGNAGACACSGHGKCHCAKPAEAKPASVCRGRFGRFVKPSRVRRGCRGGCRA